MILECSFPLISYFHTFEKSFGALKSTKINSYEPVSSQKYENGTGRRIVTSQYATEKLRGPRSDSQGGFQEKRLFMISLKVE